MVCAKYILEPSLWCIYNNLINKLPFFLMKKTDSSSRSIYKLTSVNIYWAPTTQHYTASWWERQMQGNQYVKTETCSQIITRYDIPCNQCRVPYQGSSKLFPYSLTQQFYRLTFSLLTWHHLLPEKTQHEKSHFTRHHIEVI